MLIEGFIVVVGILLIWDYLSKKRFNEMLHYMPGPKPWPLVGNALMYRNKGPEDIMSFIVANRAKYGPLYRVWVVNQLAVFSCDPDDIEVILSSPQYITKNNLYNLLQVWLGNGLLMSTGRKWYSRRKIITPTFHFKILEQFVEIFDQQSVTLVAQLKSYADGKSVVNICPFICLMALDVIAETAMGSKVNAQMNPNFPYVKAVNTVTNILANRFINVWQRIDWIFRLISPKDANEFYTSIKLMHDFTERIIIERRAVLEQSLKANNATPVATDAEVGLKRRLALLDVLLQSSIDGQPLTNEDIREEVDTFMFEGHDTTTHAISFCLHLISRHEEVQKKLFDEICQVLGVDKHESVTLRSLSELKYLECVIKEALRLYPSVPIIGRHIEEDFNLNGKLIPAGTNYTVGIFVMLRDSKYFPDPHTFRPERFLNECINGDGVKINPYSYIPFSAGPRNCIGQKFAILEMKSTISKILRHYELLPLGADVRPAMNIVLRSQNGCEMGLKPRVY